MGLVGENQFRKNMYHQIELCGTFRDYVYTYIYRYDVKAWAVIMENQVAKNLEIAWKPRL